MRNANSWHPDYACEACKRHEKNGREDLNFVKYLCSTYEVLPLVKAIADKIQNEKLMGIANTVTEIEQQIEKEGSRCRRKVTDKQRYALAVALLEEYGTARAIVQAAWGVSSEQIDNADA